MRRKAPPGPLGQKAFQCWRGMIQRCQDVEDGGHPNYGGRGIGVCLRWLESFDWFVKDMGLPPTEDHSLDRIDNDGDYEPENCRWATASQQMRNTRRATTMMFQGSEVNPNDWADVMGLARNYVYIQVNYHGLSGEQIIAERWKNRHLILAKLAKKNSLKGVVSTLDQSVESE